MTIEMTIKKHLINENIDANRILNLIMGKVSGRSISSKIGKLMFGKYYRPNTQYVKKILKDEGLSDFEINQIRDIYTMLTKNMLDRINKKYFDNKQKMTHNKDTFGVYQLVDLSSYPEYENEIDDMIQKYFIPLFNKRMGDVKRK